MWNCNGLTNDKLSEKEFTDLIEGNDIVFFSESWTDKHFENRLCDFTCFNYYRKFRHRKAKRNSGGIVVFIRDCILPGIEMVKNHYDTLIWFKLDKDFFQFKEDVYLCCVYFWPDDSTAARLIDVDLFDLISNDIVSFEQLGSVMLAGDWNARVGNKCDYVVCDTVVPDIDDNEYHSDLPLARASQDIECNSRGRKMLDLCKANSLRIANGRLGVDSNKGEYTYFSRQSHTTIDYLLLKELDFSLIHEFYIGSFNTFSDHAPLHFTIRSAVYTSKDNGPCPRSSTSLRWANEKREFFRRGLIGKLPELNRSLNDVNVNDNNSLDAMIDKFTSIIREVTEPLFKYNMKYKSSNKSNSFTNKEWFDRDCIEAKTLYRQALSNYNIYKSYENRVELCASKKSYKNMVRKKKRAFILNKSKELENLKSKRPKEFWKFFKKKQHVDSNISTDDFKEYFAGLFSDIRTTLIEEVESFNDQNAFNIDNSTFNELNVPITIKEVKDAIKNLKRNKAACPCDDILNEFFIESTDILGGHITDLFNKLFNAGYFPQSWSLGYIVPIHKKGDKNDPSNYRGITLLSNFGKLFTSVLTNRIEKWIEENKIIPDTQFGFRKGCSTVDAIFVLHNLIQHFIHNSLRLPCAFIDLKKAFDSVYRNALWFKLFHLGLDGKILVIFKSMYNIVKSCVKHCNTFSDFFDISIGLRQGQNNSPVMFSLFLQDLDKFLQDGADPGIEIFDLCLIILLFADDMVIVGKSVTDLQLKLNRLFEYCSFWGLEVNTSKTKIVVFRKRGPVKTEERWFYNDVMLDVVNDFNYLGVVLNYTGSFVLNNQYIIGKALKAMNVLLKHIKDLEVMPKISLRLFDSFVGSVLNYACPVWGLTKSKDIERLHLKFCKIILGVGQNACNAAVYGELGRYPLYVNRYVQIIKYWFKLIHSDNIVLKTLYLNSLINNNRRDSWPQKVKSILDEYGFSDVWIYPEFVHVPSFINLFKQRVIDQFRQQWFADINNNRVLCDFYGNFKTTFTLEEYLNLIVSKHLRQEVTKLRISANSLRINSARFQERIPREERFCKLCLQNTEPYVDLEDEFHFVLKCTYFDDLRKSYIKKYYYKNPSMFKFCQLLNSNNRMSLLNLCRFLKLANKRRDSLLVMFDNV